MMFEQEYALIYEPAQFPIERPGPNTQSAMTQFVARVISRNPSQFEQMIPLTVMNPFEPITHAADTFAMMGVSPAYPAYVILPVGVPLLDGLIPPEYVPPRMYTVSPGISVVLAFP